MTDEEQPLFAPTTAELGRLQAELRAAATARWQLAQLELNVAAADIKRLGVALGVAGLVGGISLPVLVVAAAEALAGQGGLSRLEWLLIWGGGLALVAAAIGWLGWRRFQRHFVGLEETLEVLREDQAWIESIVESKR